MQNKGPLNPKNADFQTMEYWDERYSREAPDADFDWFKKVRATLTSIQISCTSSLMSDIIHEQVPKKESRILMLGCGNSSESQLTALSKDMFDDGYSEIVSA